MSGSTLSTGYLYTGYVDESIYGAHLELVIKLSSISIRLLKVFSGAYLYLLDI